MPKKKLKVKRFASSEGNVWKYVFDFGDAIAEAVLYRYESFYKRTVLCVSVQCGCPVGCVFCGTGETFVRDLTNVEIVRQVKHVLSDMHITDVNSRSARFQIMFMSMGEPLLNFENVKHAILELSDTYRNAELLVSSVAPRRQEALMELLKLSSYIDKIGLQFSIHRAYDKGRDELIPYYNKLSLREIRDYGITWNKKTGRPVYLNYCVTEENQSPGELERLKDLFSPTVFNLTFSVVCSPDEDMKSKGYAELDVISSISRSFVEEGYNTRVFDPAGQDDIGGGCGQLWYVQDWMKKRTSVTSCTERSPKNNRKLLRKHVKFIRSIYDEGEETVGEGGEVYNSFAIIVKYFIIIHNYLVLEERFADLAAECSKELNMCLTLPKELTTKAEVTSLFSKLYDNRGKVRFGVETLDSIGEVRKALKEYPTFYDKFIREEG